MIKRHSTAAGIALALAAAGPGARAQAPFDHYLLALSRSPSWCAAEAGRAEADQCDPRRGLGFVLHGLWPQADDGWPEDCATAARDPSRRQTAAMADVTGSGGLAYHAWRRHGRCSGLSAEAYFALSRRAFEGFSPPALAPRMTAAEIVAATRAANPGLPEAAIVVTCRGGALAELRLCLDRGLAPRPCGAAAARGACRSRGPLDVPPR